MNKVENFIKQGEMASLESFIRFIDTVSLLKSIHGEDRVVVRGDEIIVNVKRSGISE